MISVKPTPEFEAKATVNVGNMDYVELRGMINIPMGDKVSGRLYVSDRSRDGYIKNIWDPSHVATTINAVVPGVGIVTGIPLCDYPGAATPPGCTAWAVGPDEAPNTKQKMNNVDTQSFRAQLRIQPNEKWDINIAADGLQSDRTPNLGEALTDTFGSTIDHFAPKIGELSFSEQGGETRDIWGANINIDYAFDNGYNLRSITAYRDTEINYVNDTDYSAMDFLNVDYTDAYEQTTQEFQFISPDDSNFKYVDWDLDGTRSGAFGIGTTPPGGYIDSDTYTNFAPMLTLSYSLGDNTTLYGKYSTGFKSGGFNLDYVTQADLEAGITFDEETVDSFELGWKGIYMDGRLSVNAAAFIANYDDYQVNQFFDLGFDQETGTQLTSIRITNAAEVDTSGMELELYFNATANLTLRGSLGLLDATFADFPGGTSMDIPNPDGGNPITVSVNAKGNDLPLAPSVNATLGAQWVSNFSSVDLLMSLDILYTSEYYTSIENETTKDLTGLHGATFLFDLPHFGIPNTIDYGQVDALTTVNGRIGLMDANDGSWEVFLWGRNLTDEGQYVDYLRDFFGSLAATAMTPRTYGVSATYHF